MQSSLRWEAGLGLNMVLEKKFYEHRRQGPDGRTQKSAHFFHRDLYCPFTASKNRKRRQFSQWGCWPCKAVNEYCVQPALQGRAVLLLTL